jgi:hypothetical protein
MMTAKNTYPLHSTLAPQMSALESLRQECDRLRRENATLRQFGKEAQTIAAEIALNPFAELEHLRPRASQLLALTRQNRLGR